jgi:hypothetical protein
VSLKYEEVVNNHPGLNLEQAVKQELKDVIKRKKIPRQERHTLWFKVQERKLNTTERSEHENEAVDPESATIMEGSYNEMIAGTEAVKLKRGK